MFYNMNIEKNKEVEELELFFIESLWLVKIDKNNLICSNGVELVSLVTNSGNLPLKKMKGILFRIN